MSAHEFYYWTGGKAHIPRTGFFNDGPTMLCGRKFPLWASWTREYIESQPDYMPVCKTCRAIEEAEHAHD